MKMRQSYPDISLGKLCGLFGYTRDAFYKWSDSEEKQVMQNAIIVKRVKEIRADMPRIGTRKLQFLLTDTLKDHDVKMGRDGLFDLLAHYGMLVRRRKKWKVCTTDSNHPFRKYPNLIRELDLQGPETLWVSDITYIPLIPEIKRFCYLSLITDAYSRKIVGWRLHRTLEKEGPLLALRMALRSREYVLSGNLIHHSDRGLQYCCYEYTDMLKDNNVLISMTERGDPYENAIAERVNGILKTEFKLDDSFRTFQDAYNAVDKAIWVYNEKRPHSSCNYLTPTEAHQRKGHLPTKWKADKITLAHAT